MKRTNLPTKTKKKNVSVNFGNRKYVQLVRNRFFPYRKSPKSDIPMRQAPSAKRHAPCAKRRPFWSDRPSRGKCIILKKKLNSIF